MSSQFRQCVECGAPMGSSKVCSYCGFGSKHNKTTYYLEIGDQEGEDNNTFTFQTGQQNAGHVSRDIFTFTEFGGTQSLDEQCEQNSGYAFIFCFQRVLQCQVDFLVERMNFPPILRKAIADLWLDFVDEVKFKKPLLRSKVNKKQLHVNVRNTLHRFVKVNARALRRLYLQKELKFVGFLLPKLQPYDTLVFIYLACATIGHPVMLPILRHWAMTGTIPYRKVCTELFSNDPRFRKFSSNTFSFNMYTEDNMASNFREGVMPDSRELWKRVKKLSQRKQTQSAPSQNEQTEEHKDMFKQEGSPATPFSRYIPIPDLNCEIMLRPFFPLFIPQIPQQEYDILITYTCRLIQAFTKISQPSIYHDCEPSVTTLPFWKNPLTESHMSPCMFVMCFVCMTLKLCFGLNRQYDPRTNNSLIHNPSAITMATGTHPKWAQYMIRMNEQFSRQHDRGGILIDHQPIRLACPDDRMLLSTFLEMTIHEKTFHHTLLKGSLHRQLFMGNNLQAGIKANTMFLNEMNIQGLQPLLNSLLREESLSDIYMNGNTTGRHTQLAFPTLKDMEMRARHYHLLFDVNGNVHEEEEASDVRTLFPSSATSFIDMSFLLQSMSWFMGVDPQSLISSYSSGSGSGGSIYGTSSHGFYGGNDRWWKHGSQQDVTSPAMTFQTLLSNIIVILENVLLGVGTSQNQQGRKNDGTSSPGDHGHLSTMNNDPSSTCLMMELGISNISKWSSIRKHMQHNGVMYQLERLNSQLLNEGRKELWELCLPSYQLLYPQVSFRRSGGSASSSLEFSHLRRRNKKNRNDPSMDLLDDNDEKTLGDVIMEKDQDEYVDDEWLEDDSSTFKDGDRNRFMLSLPFIQLLERLMVQQQQHNEFDEYMDGVLDRHYYRCEGSSVHEILNTKSIQKTVRMMRSTLQAHHPIIE